MNVKQKIFLTSAAVPVATYLAAKAGLGVLFATLAAVAGGYAVGSWLLRSEIRTIQQYAPIASAASDAADALRGAL